MNEITKIAVIGGGAAGLMAAGTAASFGADVTIFEHMQYVGRKIGITGKGRCNVTNACNMQEFMENWENWRPKRWEPKWNPDLSFDYPLPLMYAAGAHPNEAWGEQGVETPTSMRSVDASCQAKIIENKYVKKEG